MIFILNQLAEIKINKIGISITPKSIINLNLKFMLKQDFQSATQMLDNWKKSFDDFLKKNTALNPKDIVGSETDFGKEVAMIFSSYKDNPNVKNLDFQFKKIMQIANDIHHLKSVNDNTLPDWLEDELETVFQKIKALLVTLEKELN